MIPFLIFLHVLAAAVWLAGALWVAGDVRRTLALGKPHVDALAARVRPALVVDTLGAVATFATGVLLMWAVGFKFVRPGVNAGILFALLRVGVLVLLRRPWGRILARVQAGEGVSPADPAARRMSMLAGIAHTLWLAALAAMLWV